MTRKNWGSIQKLIVSLCLGLSPSCSEGSADETKDRYREIVDISRDEEALKEWGLYTKVTISLDMPLLSCKMGA